MEQVKAMALGRDTDAGVRKIFMKLYDSFDIDGSLEERDGFPDRRACCFRGCDAPRMKEWGKSDIEWCYDQHVRVSVGL